MKAAPRGAPSVAPVSETALKRIVRELYLTLQKPTAAWVVREVIGRGRAEKLPVPSPNTVHRRLKVLSLAETRCRGEERSETKPVHGHAPAARHPLDLVQTDHTPMDLIEVDLIDREPICRSWLTVAIDTYSRCIAGFHVTLEAPGATFVGLCPTHVAMDKAPWLAMREVTATWPVQGKPCRPGVHTDPNSTSRNSSHMNHTGQLRLDGERLLGRQTGPVITELTVRFRKQTGWSGRIASDPLRSLGATSQWKRPIQSKAETFCAFLDVRTTRILLRARQPQPPGRLDKGEVPRPTTLLVPIVIWAYLGAAISPQSEEA
jgi:hypothetical protein